MRYLNRPSQSAGFYHALAAAATCPLAIAADIRHSGCPGGIPMAPLIPTPETIREHLRQLCFQTLGHANERDITEIIDETTITAEQGYDWLKRYGGRRCPLIPTKLMR